MIRSKLENRVVWMIVEGELLADEFIDETNKWISRLDEYEGYITDVRGMTKATALNKQRIEEQRKQNNTGKASAILVTDNIMGFLAKIYINFTKATDTQFFTDPEKAAEWIRNHRKQSDSP